LSHDNNILYFFIPKEIGKRWRKNKDEPEASVIFFSSSFYEVFRHRPAPRLGRRAPPEGCLASVASKRKRKKRLVRLQVHPRRYRLTGVIFPVRKYLQVLAPQTHSGTTSATNSTWYMAGIPVGLYLWREGLYSEAKEETWIKLRVLWRLTRYGVEQD
jgi:hypothetical protein